jgi:hypothetical protein
MQPQARIATKQATGGTYFLPLQEASRTVQMASTSLVISRIASLFLL